MTYRVFVDDNYHYMDKDHRYELGIYDSFGDAVIASKKIVDVFLIENKDQYRSSDELLALYSMYGEDPFIVTNDANAKFSARTYATNKCKELYGEK